MYDGMINVYKEKGFTSHDVVAKLRGILKQKKIGHTGTLDPDATGVLPICLGKGTKLCELITDHDKTYRVKMQLGIVTDTQDISGKVLSEQPVEVSAEEVKDTALSFLGDYMQIPPMYSAIKVGGKKLYELAREGKEIERAARHVVFHQIEVVDISLPYVEMRVTCSKGTYIRTLCHDIGKKLCCGACMTELIREKVGQFDIEKSYSLAEIDDMMKLCPDKFKEIMVPLEEMLNNYPRYQVKDEAAEKMLLNGNQLSVYQIKPMDSVEILMKDGINVRVYTRDEQFIGLYEKTGQKNTLKSKKMFL